MNKRVFLSHLHPLITEQLEKGGEIILTITGNSMAPMLHHRKDKVLIIKPTNKKLKKHDIPLFKRPDGKFILHRIIEVHNFSYTLMGDNQAFKEYHVDHSQIIGVVKGFWRNDKYISCDNLLYVTYCKLWYLMYPFRWIYIKGKSLFRKIIKAMDVTYDK